MADSNWIKVNRNVWGNFIWDFENPKYALAWIDMLLMANYKDKKILFDGSVKTIKRGSFVTSMVKLSERWQMDRRAVKKFFDVLQDEGMITYECTNRCTTVNIVKYELYQGFGTTECTTECTTDAQQNVQLLHSRMYNSCTQHKKVKKEKESKESKDIYINIIFYLNQKAGTQYRHTTKKTQACISARLDEGFTIDDFKTVIDKKCAEWIGTEWEKFLRPETLFGTKFESYLNAKVSKKPETVNTGYPEGADLTDLDDIF